MFTHAYDEYMYNAYPADELRPLTCDGHDTWGSYELSSLLFIAILLQYHFSLLIDILSHWWIHWIC